MWSASQDAKVGIEMSLFYEPEVLRMIAFELMSRTDHLDTALGFIRIGRL